MNIQAWTSKSNQGSRVLSPTADLIGRLRTSLNGGTMVTPALAKMALATEALQLDDLNSLTRVGNELTTALENISNEMGVTGITHAQQEAAAIAGVLAGDIQATLSRKSEFPTVGTESMAVINSQGASDAVEGRSFGLEAYDERNNRDAVIYSIAYNYASARQDEFGETFFPTLTLAPDQVGFGINVNLMLVYDGIERKITGSFEDFKKRNIIRAVADSTVLKKEQTRIIPVHRPQSAANFSTVVAPVAILQEGESITTAPLAFAKKIDLLGISQTDALVAAGLMDMTDSLDPYVSLESVYVQVGADLIKLNVLDLPTANFTYATQENYRKQNLAFHSTSLMLNKGSKNLDGTPFADLSMIVASDLIVRLEMNVTGSVNIETAEMQAFGNSVSVYSVQDGAGGAMLDLTSGVGKAVVDAFAAAKLDSFSVTAFRTNMNRRQRGQLIDVTRYSQLYNVPLRSPITTIHPTTTDGTADASDVQALITATRIRTCNEAVTALIKAATLMSEYIDSRDEIGQGPDVLGVGRFFVRPAFMAENIDMANEINSIRSHERAEDMQAVLVNKLRDMAYRLYRDSEYKAAADALSGGIAPVPTVIIGTDPVIARYLNLTGDLRTLGSEFEVRIVSSLDYRVKGKIFVAFSTFDQNRNVAPNPLNFGNMVWGPELVLSANLMRGNSYSRETVVQPRYAFVTHCPIMGVIQVTGIPDSLNKIAIDFHQV